eukprot:TRINITY_DN760_c0_g1_i4.p1 TRINITY_DN760_c0_g1~~TRINITY_DN760_c0_g1_i4.p1  ORF type:complete len:222 (-),score=67.91 TRINITY_DN760_c0_g1_i4:127-705(-)
MLRSLVGSEMCIRDSSCKWSKRNHTLTITLPTHPNQNDQTSNAQTSPEVATLQAAGEKKLKAPQSPTCDDSGVIFKAEDVPEVIELEKQDIERKVPPGAGPATISADTGVSDFSIFKHDLQAELDAIYDATRMQLPTIPDGEDSDSDAEVEIVDVSAQLAALSQRTYESLREVGFDCPMTEDGLVDFGTVEQ